MTQELKSKCCKADMKVNCADEGTSCYICAECKNPCDPDYNVNLSNSTSLKSKCCNAKIKQISNLPFCFCSQCSKSLNPDGSRHFTCCFHPFNGFHEIDCPHVEWVIDKNGMKHIKGTEKYLKYAEFGNSENSQEKITLVDFLSDKKLHHQDLPCFNDAVAVEALKRICNQEKIGKHKDCSDYSKACDECYQEFKASQEKEECTECLTIGSKACSEHCFASEEAKKCERCNGTKKDSCGFECWECHPENPKNFTLQPQEKEEKNCADWEKEFKNELDRFALMIYELSPDNFDACRAHKYRYSRDAFFALIEQMYFKKRKKYKNCNCNLWPQYIQ